MSATIGHNVRLETVSGVVGGVDKHGEIIVNGTSYATGNVTHLRPAN